MASLGIHMRCHINLRSRCSVRPSLFGVQRFSFHKSRSLRWVSPETLSINELRRECERRDLPVSGTRNALIERIKFKLSEIGGYDNGLTFDENLIALKRQIETEMNKIPDNAYISTQLAVERSVFDQLRAMYDNDDRVKFESDGLVVTLEGKYVETCALRAQISAQAAEIASKETSYSLPHNVVVSLKEKFLRDIRRDHNVKFQVSRCRDNAANAIVLTVQGESQDRMAACDVLETIVKKIRYSQFEVTPLESYERPTTSKRKRRNRSSSAMQRALVISPDSWNTDVEGNSFDFTFFDGIVMHVDLRTKEMLESYRNRINLIAEETETKIHLGGKDMYWLNETQLAIESSQEDNVRAARVQCDQLINQLKSLTMTIALPQHLNEHFLSLSAKDDIQSLAEYLQRYYGVDSMIMEHGERIYIHLVGTPTQVNQAVCAVDTRVFRLNRLSKGSAEAQLSMRRERIRNLDFGELGIGGMEESLGIMLRRTFESRLISPRLRKELGLTHIRGVLLHGAPGTGKTLIARKISDILGCKKPRVVNGPEVESKWVGEAEKNIRKLFEPDDEEDMLESGGQPSMSKEELNVVIFDEIDSIAKKRGGAHGKSRDGALNQLLCCMDGVQERDDILVFGLTNRKDCLDPALLRPGRLEVQLEIPLPDLQGREDILKIHTRPMKNYGRLCDTVDLRLIASYAEDFSGADLAGVVRSAISFALEECEGDDEDSVVVRADHLEKGLHEVRMAKDRMPSAEADDMFPAGNGLMQA